ncbi:hypothetical protein GUJ93_ZPchr0010g9224 [Zizania palustris]|uniref:Uncharacterized protein n=1 Tax=Zizania palustris TaxID=103762 RepID=A0A8J6BLF3_ZIZPA|nr:hypothetical protein GUJ93_ZPchr0010g9224 [Zizania palustris]KAG8086920.1 hypothetical protein GUJ93_ZPchr0010g9224 [Zizania palustris]
MGPVGPSVCGFSLSSCCSDPFGPGTAPPPPRASAGRRLLQLLRAGRRFSASRCRRRRWRGAVHGEETTQRATAPAGRSIWLGMVCMFMLLIET